MAEEQFKHTVDAWTVGRLRSALDGLPDDMPVRIWVADAPGGNRCDEQVIIAAVPENNPPTHFGIEAEFPPGTYYRYRDEGKYDDG